MRRSKGAVLRALTTAAVGATVPSALHRDKPDHVWGNWNWKRFDWDD